MTTAAPSAALATIQPVFTDPERLALAGFLAGYRGLTREAYALLGTGVPARRSSAWQWQPPGGAACSRRCQPPPPVTHRDLSAYASRRSAYGSSSVVIRGMLIRSG